MNSDILAIRPCLNTLVGPRTPAPIAPCRNRKKTRQQGRDANGHADAAGHAGRVLDVALSQATVPTAVVVGGAPSGAQAASPVPPQQPTSVVESGPAATEAAEGADAEPADAEPAAAAAPTQNGPVSEPAQAGSAAAASEEAETGVEGGMPNSDASPAENGRLAQQPAQDTAAAVPSSEPPPHPDTAVVSEEPSVTDEAPAAAVEQRGAAWSQPAAAVNADQAQQDK